MSARNNGHGRPSAARKVRRNRAIAIAVILALVLGAFGVGYVLATSGGDAQPITTPTAAASSEGLSPSPEPSESPSEEASESVSPAPSGDILPDGRSFVYAKGVAQGTAGPELTFDLAEFLTDEAAQEAATAHDDEVTDGYYIVNDNPLLRTMPIAPDAIVRYVPDGTCCSLKAGNLEAWSEAVNGTAQTDYPNMQYTGWWLTVQDGEIVRISQQWVP
jgi:hypothetical protein